MQRRGLLLVGDGVEEALPDEEDGGLLVLLLDVHGYVHDTHSSHIYLSRKIILVQLGIQHIHKYSVAEPEPVLRIRIRSDPDLFALSGQIVWIRIRIRPKIFLLLNFKKMIIMDPDPHLSMRILILEASYNLDPDLDQNEAGFGSEANPLGSATLP